MRKFKYFVALLAALAVILTLADGCATQEKPIVILHENDAHCALEGYVALAGLCSVRALLQVICLKQRFYSLEVSL